MSNINAKNPNNLGKKYRTQQFTDRLNEQQLRFVEHYAVSHNALQAAKAAGYAHPHQYGPTLLKHPAIVWALNKIAHQQTAITGVTIASVLTELSRMAHADLTQAFNPDGTVKPLHEIPEDVRRAIEQIEVREVPTKRGPVRTTTVKMSSKIQALDRLARYLKLYGDTKEMQDLQINLTVIAPPGAALPAASRVVDAEIVTAEQPASDSKGEQDEGA